ncbi:flagellar filament capping protein FliD [Magnetococcales bacterium HHB-1]
MALGSVTFGGLASGLPPDMVDQLMSAQQTRLNAMKRDQSYYEGQKGAFNELKSKLSTMENKASELKSASEFTPYTAASSDEDYITATASSSAVAGLHTVSITSLAQSQVNVSKDSGTPVTSLTAGLTAAETITISYNDPAGTDGTLTNEFSFAAGTTLSGIASTINDYTWDSTDSNVGVIASVINDGDSYRLVLSAKETGQYLHTDDNWYQRFTTTIDGSGDSVLSFDDGTTIEAMADPTADGEGIDAANASFSIDGVAVTSTSNTVDDIVTGVTLNLLNSDAGASTFTVTVAEDTTTLKETLNSFISAYNDVVDYIDSQKSGLFQTESLARSVKSMLRSVINTSTTQSDGTTMSPYNMLASLGIETNAKTGKLSLDSDVFSETIGQDYSAAANIFTTELDDDDNGSAGIAYRMVTMIDSLTDSSTGSLSSKIKGLDSRLDRVEDRIEREEVRLEKMRERLTKQYASLEQMMSTLNSQSASMMSTLGAL